MRLKTGIYLIGVTLFMVTLLSCNFQNEKSDEPIFIRVHMTVDQPVMRNANISQASPATSTSLVIAVPASITSVDEASWDQSYFDAQLLDLNNDTVTLLIPLGTSMRLITLDYSADYTLDNIKTNNPTADEGKGISDPFTVDINTTSKTVVVYMGWRGTQQFGTATSEHAHEMVIDSSNNIYLVGHTDATFDGQSYAGAGDVYVAKFSSSGLKQWIRLLGDSGADMGTAVAVDSNKNVYITGHSTSSILGGASRTYARQQFLSQFNSSGVRQWTEFIGTSTVEANEGKRIAVDNANNIYLTEVSNTLMKYNTSGSLEATSDSWYSQYYEFDIVPEITIDGSGNIYVAYYDVSENAMHILKFNSSLSFVSDTTSDAAGIYFGITTDSSGNVYITSSANSTTVDGESCPVNPGNNELFVKKYNSSMVRQWTRLLCSSSYDYGLDIAVDSSGNVYVSGFSTGPLDGETYVGGSDVIIAKYDSNGQALWHDQFGSVESEDGENIALDNQGNIYISGTTYGNLDGNTNADSSYYTEDVFISKYNSSGQRICANDTPCP